MVSGATGGMAGDTIDGMVSGATGGMAGSGSTNDGTKDGATKSVLLYWRLHNTNEWDVDYIWNTCISSWCLHIWEMPKSR